MCPARFPIGLVNVSGLLTYPPPFIFHISQASPEKVPLSLAFVQYLPGDLAIRRRYETREDRNLAVFISGRCAAGYWNNGPAVKAEVLTKTISSAGELSSLSMDHGFMNRILQNISNDECGYQNRQGFEKPHRDR